MIHTRLNLLSQEKRAYLKHLVYDQFFKNLLEIILVILCFTAIALLGSQWVLQKYFVDVSGQITSVADNNATLNQRIREVNEKIAVLDTIQKQYILWTPRIAEVTAAIPPRIHLSQFAARMKDKKIIIAGTAETRDDLLLLQKQLKEVSFIASADIPLSQLTEKENIPFSITAVMREEKEKL